MKEIEGNKKLEVAQCYVLGFTYKEIEEKTGVSHGSIANIVKDIEQGKIEVAGTATEQVSVLRQLSFALKKKELSLSQAINGSLFFGRCVALGIKPELLDNWAALVNEFVDAKLPPEDFLKAAIGLHQLEKAEGKSFEELVEECQKAKEGLGQLADQVESLTVKRKQLLDEIEPLGLQVGKLKKERSDHDIQTQAVTKRLQELKSDVRELEAERAKLKKDIKALKLKSAELSSEIGGKEDILARINDIGFFDEDLIRVRTILEKMAEDNGVSDNEIKGKFFMALDAFKDIGEIHDRRTEEAAKLENLTKTKSLLTGEIAGLERRRDILSGEIKESTALAVKEIKDAGAEAATQIRDQVENIQGQLGSLMAEAVRVSGVVGEMNAMVKKGEAAEKSLDRFIREVSNKLEVK